MPSHIEMIVIFIINYQGIWRGADGVPDDGRPPFPKKKKQIGLFSESPFVPRSRSLFVLDLGSG